MGRPAAEVLAAKPLLPIPIYDLDSRWTYRLALWARGDLSSDVVCPELKSVSTGSEFDNPKAKIDKIKADCATTMNEVQRLLRACPALWRSAVDVHAYDHDKGGFQLTVAHPSWKDSIGITRDGKTLLNSSALLTWPGPYSTSDANEKFLCQGSTGDAHKALMKFNLDLILPADKAKELRQRVEVAKKGYEYAQEFLEVAFLYDGGGASAPLGCGDKTIGLPTGLVLAWRLTVTMNTKASQALVPWQNVSNYDDSASCDGARELIDPIKKAKPAK